MNARRDGTAVLALLALLTVALFASAGLALVTGAAEDDTEAGKGAGPELSAPEVEVPEPPLAVVDPTRSLVATALAPRTGVYAASGATQPALVLNNPNSNGAPLIFLVQEAGADWLRVLLPVRTKADTGWVRASDVKLTQHNYRVVVELRAHRITVFGGTNVLLRERIGVGTRAMPKPGTYYIKELLRPPGPNGPYGVYAYGLSGFSDQRASFTSGDDLVAIHGTNDLASIGKNVSFGSIRMSNTGISWLKERLPLGTPVEIRA